MTYRFDKTESSGLVILSMSGKPEPGDNEQSLSEFRFLRASGATSVILSLEGVEILYSWTLGAIVAFAESITESGGKFAVCCVPERLQYLFDISRISSVVAMYSSMEAAKEAIEADGEVTKT